MKCICTILIILLFILTAHPQNAYKVYFNEVRANDSGTDDLEFIELIGPTGTDITGFQIIHYNGSESSDGGIWTHICGSFVIPDDGIVDKNGMALGFYLVGADIITQVDESQNWSDDHLQNGPDGLVLYDAQGSVLDAIAWEGAGDMEIDDPGNLVTTGSTSANNFLHIILDDDADDNSVQAPSDVLGDDGSGWILDEATPGALNAGQISGDVSLPVKLSAFNIQGGNNKVLLRWVTESEIENAGFEILRSCEDKGEYQLIASYMTHDELKGKLNSNTCTIYHYIDKLVMNDITYWYKLVDVSLNGKRTFHGPIATTPQALEDELMNVEPGLLPDKFALYQNFPNPFNPGTTIHFEIPSLPSNKSIRAKLNIYNGLGQMVRKLYQGDINPGSYEIYWNGMGENGMILPNGIYFALLRADFYHQSIKMVMIK
jgi:hypothetical protein